MKAITIILSSMLFCNIGWSCTTIYLLIQDSEQKPIPYTDIIIYHEDGQEILQQTDAKGFISYQVACTSLESKILNVDYVRIHKDGFYSEKYYYSHDNCPNIRNLPVHKNDCRIITLTSRKLVNDKSHKITHPTKMKD